MKCIIQQIKYKKNEQSYSKTVKDHTNKTQTQTKSLYSYEPSNGKHVLMTTKWNMFRFKG